MSTVKVFVLGGTPGTGKTSIAREIQQKIPVTVVHLTDFVKTHQLWEEYDESRDSYVIAEDKLVQKLQEFIQSLENTIVLIEGHFIELVPSEFVKSCVILRTGISELRERLQTRGYKEKKIQENLEAELMEICLTEALYAFGPEKTRVIDTTKKSLEEVANEVIQAFHLIDRDSK